MDKIAEIKKEIEIIDTVDDSNISDRKFNIELQSQVLV